MASSSTNSAMPARYGDLNTSVAPANGFPPSGARRCSAVLAPWGSGCRSRHWWSHTAVTPLAPISSEDNSIRPPCPRWPTSSVVSSGPASPPRLAPLAISANRRLASLLARTSASTLQAREISSRLITDTQM